MKNNHLQKMNTPIIDQSWPSQDLENVLACPICESKEGKKLFTEVKDWAFNCAPGDWTYWTCLNCQSLYLNPRPTSSSIGRAYGSYYTHSNEVVRESSFDLFRQKLRNECLYHWLGIDTNPRLYFKSKLLFYIFRPFIFRKYPLDELNKYPRGSLLDVGCGNGELMDAARSMGFSVAGLEIDPVAVGAAVDRGLSVRQGSYDLLSEYENNFDYIICSHVLEHVHDPRQLLQLLIKAIKPGGRVFITWPNPKSVALKLFGKHWRGLEAPRHLCLLSENSFFDYLQKNSISNIRTLVSGVHTIGESWKIRHQKIGMCMKLINKFVYLITSLVPSTTRQDFVTVSFQKPILNSILEKK
jgi:2-polyprenyl-3-methyl-5-hydroxy-6-metoxy-1,4-benzoquinol methylase